MTRIEKLEGAQITNNIELKQYLDDVRRTCFDLYVELMWTSDVLQQSLATIKGVKNIVRAKVIAASLRAAAENFRMAGSATAKTWALFERHFGTELAEAASSKRKKPEKFVIK